MKRDDILDGMPALRGPPSSQEAEQSVLGAILLDNDALGLVSWLQPAHFYGHEHRATFATVQALIAAGKTADVVSVFEAGGHDLGYVNSLAGSVVSSRNIERHAEIVRDKATLRAVIAAADEASTLAFGGGDAPEIADKAASMMAGIQRATLLQAPRSLSEIAIRRTAHYEALERGDVLPGWPTGIPGLDAMLNGGLRPGGLYILAARPGVGKSSLSLSILSTLASQGLPSLMLSLEMPAEEVADRAVVHAGHVDYASLLSGKLDGEGWSRAADALDRLGRLPLHVDDQSALTLGEIKAKARSVKGLKVLVLDYLQLCAGTNSRDNRNTQLEEITRGLKTLAKAEGVAVIALSQLNREVEKRGNKRPNMADLRDSGAIEQDADVVLFLWPVRELGDRQIVGLAVEKNRQGARGKVAMDFHGATQRWGQSTADIDAPQTRMGGAGSFE